MPHSGNIVVGSSFPSQRSNLQGAIDVCVAVGGVSGVVTLTPRALDGVLDLGGGDPAHWLSPELLHLDAQLVREVIAAIRPTLNHY